VNRDIFDEADLHSDTGILATISCDNENEGDSKRSSLMCLADQYRMVDKYIRQFSLMEMSRTFIVESCLASDVASIAITYLLDLPGPGLKYAIQFLHIERPRNHLQAAKK
jgi:hypothetical protein